MLFQNILTNTNKKMISCISNSTKLAIAICIVIVCIVACLCVMCGIQAKKIENSDALKDKLIESVRTNHTPIKNFKWPPNFMMGVSTAAFQNEGFHIHSTWSQWTLDPSKVRDTPLQACDAWNNFEDVDVKNAQFLGCNSFRLSLDWSRIEPKKGVFDDVAMIRYARMIQSLMDANIQPVITLIHFALPHWTSGWEDHTQVSKEFRVFVEYVCVWFHEHLTTFPKYWVTINEPCIDAINTHMLGTRWPGKKGIMCAIRAMRGMWCSHNEAFATLKKWDKGCEVSIAKNTVVPRVLNNFSPIDWVIHKGIDWFYNYMFIDACISGRFDVMGIKASGPGKTLTYLGVNFYNVVRVGLKGGLGPLDLLMTSRDPVENVNSMGWEMRPAAMFTVLQKMWTRFKLPILITEAGNPDTKEQGPYLAQQMYCIANALHVNIPVLGYLHWTLHDSYEWCEGFMGRFGLFETDFEGLRSSIAQATDPCVHFKPRPAAHTFKTLCGYVTSTTNSSASSSPPPLLSKSIV
jgi:beta-glucosidase